MPTRKNISEKKRSKKVLVGISGGVDSSVSAILLQKEGYEVEGVFAKVWQPDFVECTWRDEMKDAMRVCARLDIPFHFLDLEKEYKALVGDYMISEYQAGRTPNPDVMCNTHIKFGLIYEFAMQNGFDYVATGHYAQNIDGQLSRGADTNKDQSYFLWNVARDKFRHILFPIGGLEKSEVRAIASRHKLFTAEKKDSQGLCFIGPVDMKSFLKNLIRTSPGDVLNTSGEVIGAHEGAQLYTVGERHGFAIHPVYKDTHDKALFVIGKNVEKNTLTIDSAAPTAKEIILDSVNLLMSSLPEVVEVQFRYRQTPLRAICVEKNGKLTLVPQEPAEFVAIGQSAVMYAGPVCIGGGVVDKVVY
jgi:tRNA-uridine 2-sulfurtransferase